MKREWIAPGIILAVLTLGGNFASAWAVDRWRTNKMEEGLRELREDLKQQNAATNARIDGLDTRLQEMARGERDTARLQEKNLALEVRIGELRADLKEFEGRGAARYDNLSTRLARAGF